MSGFLVGVAAFVALCALLGLVRLLRGPGAVDRMMAVQLVGTTGAAICLLVALAKGLPAMIDVALTLAVLAALATAALTRLATRAPRRSGEDPGIPAR